MNGENVARVTYKNRDKVLTFSKVTPGTWMMGEGEIFKEESRDEWSVYLVRTKGGKGGDELGFAKAQIDLYTKKITLTFPKRNHTETFEIISSSKRKK